MVNDARWQLDAAEFQVEQGSAAERSAGHRESGAPQPCGADCAPSDSAGAVKARFLEDLYRLHWRGLCNWLRQRFGAGPPSPEDIAQAAFAKMATLDRAEHLEHPKAYLYTTAINTALDEVQWRKRTDKFIEHELHRTGQALEEITPERVYLAREQFALLARKMDQLSPKQKEIVTRSRFLGQTYEQISAETGWSLADISRQLSAAMIAIQKALGVNKPTATTPVKKS